MRKVKKDEFTFEDLSLLCAHCGYNCGLVCDYHVLLPLQEWEEFWTKIRTGGRKDLLEQGCICCGTTNPNTRVSCLVNWKVRDEDG